MKTKTIASIALGLAGAAAVGAVAYQNREKIAPVAKSLGDRTRAFFTGLAADLKARFLNKPANDAEFGEHTRLPDERRAAGAR